MNIKRLMHSYRLILAAIAGILFFSASAQRHSDSSHKLLASLSNKDNACYITKESNIIFPAVLNGNEAQTLDYIEKFCNNRKDYIVRTYTKGKKYFGKAATILKKYNLPNELKVLLALESAFNANAVSRAGAVGYWQFMDEVAKEYGLKVVTQYTPEEKKKLLKANKKKADSLFKALAKQKDDRKNFNKSTYAAARYLRDRSRNLNNDLLLMVASYNCGIGNVWDAMNASGKNNPTYWDIKESLPAETQAYVLNFITLNVIFNNYDKFTSNTMIFKPEKIRISEPNAGGVE